MPSLQVASAIKPVAGGFAAYEDGFTALELCRKYYHEAGLDLRQLDSLIR